MGRAPLDAGTLGKIRVRERKPGSWNASAKARTLSGARLSLSGSGTTEQEAVDSLRGKFYAQVVGLPRELTPTDSFENAVLLWHATLRGTETYDRYGPCSRRLIDITRGLTLERLDSQAMELLVQGERRLNGRRAAKELGDTLMRVVRFAVRSGALDMAAAHEQSHD